jgi:ribosomal protein S1
LVGDEIKAEIIEINEGKKRVRLSIRRLKRKEVGKNHEEKLNKEKREENHNQFFSSDDEGVMIKDFIEEKIKKKLKGSFKNEN